MLQQDNIYGVVVYHQAASGSQNPTMCLAFKCHQVTE